jgi:hypothetical protein
MADVKITALTAISTNPVNPATFPIPMVDLLDFSMAASGTTKKVTVNQILGSGGTATLASATITGAATVGTTLGVTGVSTFAAGTAALPALTTTGDTNTGIYYPAADTFAVTTGGTERYRVDSSGNVGVGVTPSAWDSGYKAIDINAVSSYVGTATGTDIWHNARVTGSVPIYKTTAAASFYRQSAGVNYWFNAPSGTAGNAITFTQAMTLDASGNLYLKTTSRLSSGVFSVAYVPGTSQGAVFQPNSDVSSPTPIQFLNSSGSSVGSITTTVSATAYNTSSDYRLKQAVQPLSGGLARVSALKPSAYKWKVDGSNGEGFLAHELAEVVPLAVTGNKDAVDADGKPTYQGVDLSKLVPILVAAIQELTARVQTLEAR